MVSYSGLQTPSSELLHTQPIPQYKYIGVLFPCHDYIDDQGDRKTEARATYEESSHIQLRCEVSLQLGCIRWISDIPCKVKAQEMFSAEVQVAV